MIFETHQLEGKINEYVESIFYFKDFSPNHSIERVVPTGHVFIIFELDGFVRNTFDNNTLKPKNSYTKVWISGVHKNYISISAHQKSEMLVIQFKPFGAYPFLHCSIDKLTEEVINAEEILGQEIIALREKILLANSSIKKFKHVVQWLIYRFKENKLPSNEFLNMVSNIQRETLSNNKNYSKTQKHFINQFKKYVGITPKYYQRILRFNEILSKIHNSEKIEWSQIAYEFNYSDQSHFIKEFKHFSGVNPQEFIQQNFHKEEPNFFPLDKKG